MFVKALRNYLPFILIVVLASVLRLWNLGSVPISLADDEIRVSYTAYSIAQTGKDVYGNLFPLVFKIDGFSTFGQLPIYISSLFFSFLPLSSFIARLPFALSGIISIIFFFLIVREVTKNKDLALISSFVLSVSVWSIQINRIAIDVNIAILMYLIAMYFFISSKNKTYLFVLSMLFFVLAFYSYAATKIIFLPLLTILIWYKFKDLSKNKILIVIATIIISFGSFAILDVFQGAANYGGSPLFFQNSEQTSMAVELERRASNKPSFIENAFHNKFTYWGRVFSTNYLAAFSPQFLFLNQESNGIYSIWGRGELYSFEAFFLIIGLFYLFTKKRKEFYLILLLLLISPLPSALGVNTPTWMSRSAFMAIWFSVFVGTGIYALTNIRNNKFRYVLIVIIFIFYSYSIIGYISQYYYDWSRTNAKYFSESTKHLVNKIDLYRKEGKDVLASGATENTFLHYAFYNKIDPRLVQDNINKYPITFNNFTFQKECLKEIPNNIVYISFTNCLYKDLPLETIKTYDGVEVIWNIYEK